MASYPIFPGGAAAPAVSRVVKINPSMSNVRFTLYGAEFTGQVEVSNAISPDLPEHLFVPADNQFDSAGIVTAGDAPFDLSGPVRFARIRLLSGAVTGGNVMEFSGQNVAGNLTGQSVSQSAGQIAVHNNDPAAHNLAALAAELRATAGANEGKMRLPLMYDHFNRADAALAGQTPVVTSANATAWRNVFGATSAVVKSNAYASSGGNAYAMLDLPGHQLGNGVTGLHMVTTIGSGDAWFYAWFSEGTPSGVVLQRGSDRIRVGTQLGGTITWAQEYMLSAPGTPEAITLLLDSATRKATVQLNGNAIISGVQLPTVSWGNSVGLRVGGNAAVDHVAVYREVLL